MNVVLDTNVVLSGLLFGGVPGRILTAWSEGAYTWVVSPPILQEYRRVGVALAKGRTAVLEPLDTLFALVTVHATLVNPPPLHEPVSEDPDDDMFLAAALAGHAHVVVSGDKHLLRVSGWQGIEVCKPRTFLDREMGRTDI